MTYYSCDCRLSNLLTILRFNQHTDSYLPVNLDVEEILFLLKLNSYFYRAQLERGQLETAKCGKLGGNDLFTFTKCAFPLTHVRFMSFAFGQEK